MQLNISYPQNGTQKTIEIENEHNVRPFYEKRISQEVPGDSLGEDWEGYVFKINGWSAVPCGTRTAHLPRRS